MLVLIRTPDERVELLVNNKVSLITETRCYFTILQLVQGSMMMGNEKKQPAEAVEEESGLAPTSTHFKEEKHDHDRGETHGAGKGPAH